MEYIKLFCKTYVELSNVAANIMTGGVYGNLMIDVNKFIYYEQLSEESQKMASSKGLKLWEVGNVLTGGALYSYVVIKNLMKNL